MVIPLKVQTGMKVREENDGKAGTQRGESCHNPSLHMRG